MNQSENNRIVNSLKQILEYYDFLEYDAESSKGTDQLCVCVVNPNIDCSTGILNSICSRLGDEYTFESEKPMRFFIRRMDDDDYRDYYRNMVIPLTEEELGPEPDSATAFYYRGLAKHLLGQYESAIADYNEVLRLEKKTKGTLDLHLSLSLGAAKKAKQNCNRQQIYHEYHSKFLDREAKRKEVIKRHGTPEWQTKVSEVLKRDGMLCVCGDKATEVHHKTYENLGQEQLSDLVALCMYCYRGIHSGEKIKLCKGSNPMNSVEYREKYLQSSYWKEKRKKVLERDRNLCICGERATYVHHKTYDNLGQEPLSDLVALCKNCHDGYHGYLFVRCNSFWHMRG